jgi:hypothetical protein
LRESVGTLSKKSSEQAQNRAVATMVVRIDMNFCIAFKLKG